MDNFIIAAGGTGAMCARAFIYMAAAGCANNSDTYHILLMDKDKQSDAVTACENLLAYYNLMRTQMGLKPGTCTFPTIKVHKWNFTDEIVDEYVKQTHNSAASLATLTLNKLLNPRNDAQMRQILKTMYTTEELDTDLEKGFYGHPNIGAPVFDYVTFVGMFRSDLYEGLCVGHAPKKCPVCGRWFLTTNAKRTKYCGSYTPEDRLHRTCRQIGNLKGREQRELAEDHPLKQIYTRRLDSINHRLQRRSMEPALAKVMKKLAKDKLYQAISNVGYAQGEYENEMELSALEAEALALL